MEKKNLFERLKRIREEGIVGANVPTNAMAHGNIAGSAEAGDDPPVRKRKKKKYIYMKGVRKTWKPENGRAS
tara:strand:- start:18 stop:233 length:216 start_codon:yes stop_codon:yes gene_type:complete